MHFSIHDTERSDGWETKVIWHNDAKTSEYYSEVRLTRLEARQSVRQLMEMSGMHWPFREAV
jgi:hypothetical protein